MFGLNLLRFGNNSTEEKQSNREIPTPRTIKQYLDRFVVGQDYAKRTLATIMREHLLRYFSWEKKNTWEVPEQSNKSAPSHLEPKTEHIITVPASALGPGMLMGGTIIASPGMASPEGVQNQLHASRVTPQKVGELVRHYFDVVGPQEKIETFINDTTTLLQANDLRSTVAQREFSDRLKQAVQEGLIRQGTNKFKLKALENQVFKPEEDPDYMPRIFSKLLLKRLDEQVQPKPEEAEKQAPLPPMTVQRRKPPMLDEDEPYGDVSALPWLLAEQEAQAAQQANGVIQPDPLENTPMLEKTNVLLVGHSGSGKTFIIQTLLNFINERLKTKIPLVIEDATQFTEAGYVGKHIDQIASHLLEAADGDVASAQWGVVYFDEVDKKMATGESGRDVAGIGVQQSLLRIMEKGGRITASYQGRSREIDMSNVLFITGGAFSQGLLDIIRKRLVKNPFGFVEQKEREKQEALDDENVLLREAEPVDFVNYGMLKEFMGRIGQIVTFDKPDRAMLRRILTEPENSILKQFQGQMKHEGIDLQFTEGALDAIADYAAKLDTGARSLRNIVNRVTEDIRFEAPDLAPGTKVVIDEAMVKEALSPKYLKKKTS